LLFNIKLSAIDRQSFHLGTSFHARKAQRYCILIPPPWFLEIVKQARLIGVSTSSPSITLTLFFSPFPRVGLTYYGIYSLVQLLEDAVLYEFSQHVLLLFRRHVYLSGHVSGHDDASRQCPWAQSSHWQA